MEEFEAGGEVQVRRLVVGVLATNCYIVWGGGTEAVVIDPGDDADIILDVLRDESLSARYVIDTHGHADHAGANGHVVEATGAALVIDKEDAEMLGDEMANISAFMGRKVLSPPAEILVADGDGLSVDDLKLTFLHTPGHTQGSMCVRCDGALFSGDTLFAGSVGRSDLPGGSARQLSDSLRSLMSLPDETVVYPGHGEPTTMAREKRVNPFLQGEQP